MEWLIGGIVVWFIYRIVTVGPRRNKYFMEAIIWKTGGIVGTGTIDIHQAVSLFEKASSLGHAQASFELGAIYEDGWIHPTSSRSSAQIKPNEALSCAYFRKCQTQSPEVYSQLINERKQMKEYVEEHLQRMMLVSKSNRECDEEYEDEDQDQEYELIADVIFQAYEKRGLYETNINWHEAIGFAEQYYDIASQYYHEDLNGGEGTFNTVINGNDVIIRVVLNPKNGNARFIVADAQKINDLHQKMRSGIFDPEEFLK